MASSTDAWEELYQGLELLRDRFPVPDWTYDRRLKCVVVSFPKSLQDVGLEAAAALLPTTFTAASLDGAPEPVRALAGTCGGLRASQLLLWGGAADGPGAFGLVWPWGDGTTVSLRIGLHGVDTPKERYPRLRDIFGIPQAPPAS